MEDMNKNEETKKEFAEADKRFDSKVQLKKKVFMKLSDIDPEDAKWFKDFCDRNTEKKQFLGLKVMRTLMERFEPFVGNLLSQVDLLNKRVSELEILIASQQQGEEEPQGVQIPKTMGSALKEVKK